MRWHNSHQPSFLQSYPLCNGKRFILPPRLIHNHYVCRNQQPHHHHYSTPSLHPAPVRASLPSNTTIPAILLTFSLLLHPISPSVSAQATNTTAPPVESKVDLAEISRRNTRLTGNISRQFTSAKRTAERGDLPRAEQLYTDLINSPDGGNCAPAYSNRGNLRVALQRYQEALNDYDRAIQLAPQGSETWIVHVNRGATRLALISPQNDTDDVVDFGKGQRDIVLKEALADMNRALELKGGDRLVWSNRAAVYEAMSRWDNALADYQRAVEQAGNDIQPFWFNYGLALHQRGKSYEALTVLNRVALKFGENRSEICAARAAIHYDRGEIADAETYWSFIERPKLYESRRFLSERKRWPPKIIDAITRFRNLKE